MIDPLLQAVQNRIQKDNLSLAEAAKLIGITPASLERHLGGAYVRSDSMARYRAWLNGSPRAKAPRKARRAVPEASTEDKPLYEGKAPEDLPFTVVDLFSGCGGMSLGFDLFRYQEEPVFQLQMALDQEKKVTELHNSNHKPYFSHVEPARCADLSDFLNEAEILAFYLDHCTSQGRDLRLRQDLDDLPGLSLSDFRQRMATIDATFLADLVAIRSGSSFQEAYRGSGPTVFGQTSVVGFHQMVCLPPVSPQPHFGPLIWAEAIQPGAKSHSALRGLSSLQEEAAAQARTLWTRERQKLEERAKGNGKGQLASSARRIGGFLEFLDSEPMQQIRQRWEQWHSHRRALRLWLFQKPKVEKALRQIYAGSHTVDVLLGGPPCQGFSRIGRGKIRSLRDHQVHVESDPDAGDLRNRLFLKYVLFISALEPRVFLFENVRHFQAKVQAPEGTFDAIEILSEAIETLSKRHLRYAIADQIIDCSRHGIPQTRERYMMAGIRSDVGKSLPIPDPAGWCFRLPEAAPVPLLAALADLPEPILTSERQSSREGLSGTVSLGMASSSQQDAIGRYREWLRQPFPGKKRCPASVDGHYIRPPRGDDAALFSLLGPGGRWMDYRCDKSSTLGTLQKLLCALRKAAAMASDDPIAHPVLELLQGLDPGEIDSLLSKTNGSLSLRLLLECMEPGLGELEHHLLGQSYLDKREGNNGDWIARLHPDRPCKTIVSHMAKDTYAYVHPWQSRTLSVREAARVQTFPDWFRFGQLGLVDAFRAVGNAVPPMLGYQLAAKVAQILFVAHCSAVEKEKGGKGSGAGES